MSEQMPDLPARDDIELDVDNLVGDEVAPEYDDEEE